jgi:hypothetical protein
VKKSLVLLLVATLLFALDWVSFAFGYPIYLLGQFLLMVYVALFLAIMALYLKLNELEQRKA